MRPTFPSTEEDREFGRWQSEVERRLGELESSGPLRNASITDGALRVLDESKDERVRVGKLTGGSFGVEVADAAGKTVRLDTLAFGTDGATVTATQTPPDDSYGDMSTVGPTVTVDVGETGRLLVFIRCEMGLPVGDGVAYMSFQISGASSVSPSNSRALIGGPGAFGAALFVDGLNSGSHTVRAKYKRDSLGGPDEIGRRELVAMPF